MNNYNSQENKALIWSTLEENNMFHGLNEKQYNKVVNVFEKVINTFLHSGNRYNNSMDFNKDVMITMVDELDKLKTKKLEMVYSNESRIQERTDEFNDSFKEKENEMNALLQPKMPENVNFQDSYDDKPIGENMDRMVAEMIASREKTLDMVPLNKDAAAKWINNGQSKEDKNLESPKEKTSNDENKKKVTFEMLEQTQTQKNKISDLGNFLEKIQNKPSENINTINTNREASIESSNFIQISEVEEKSNFSAMPNHSNTILPLLNEIEKDLLGLLRKIQGVKELSK